MPVLRDKDGNLYRIPSKDLQRYKVTEEEVRKHRKEPTAAEADDEVSGREMGISQIPGVNAWSAPWYSGD